MVIIIFLTYCGHLKGIKSEFRGQRMLQLVVTEGHSSLKSQKCLFGRSPTFFVTKSDDTRGDWA